MIITNTITKKLLENIVQQTFINFGMISSSALLDSLKLLGFYYATTSGISINIEDLKTPNTKKNLIEKANEEVREVSEKWQKGLVSDTERFQTIIDSWNLATESLKNRVVQYYQNYDPTNNLYIMAFSGARGNISQVRQLVGMRGLMSDQEGKIIDLPIQTNFREGLSSIDYIISSYGARKGIVDTALKTADSGYLTRRLIYIAQDLVIRENDCKTKEGIITFITKKTNLKNIIGRTLISFDSKEKLNKDEFFNQKNQILDLKTLNSFKLHAPLRLLIRTPLTCESSASICQKCYGWDLAHGKLISLGEAVGTIAAQSIGEPGTQLTMRTFHTGGIFTGEFLKQITAPFSGKLLLPKELKSISYRTNHGEMVRKLQEEITIILIDWQGVIEEIFLEIGSYLYISQSGFIRKGQLISEYTSQSVLPMGKRLKPIYASSSGEIRLQSITIRVIEKQKRIIRVNEDSGVLWITYGKIFSIPNESEYLFSKELTIEKPFSRLKLVSPYNGVITQKEGQLILKGPKKSLFLDINNLTAKIKNCSINFFSLVKNYQYIDKYTVLGFFNLFPFVEGKIYLTRKKVSVNNTIYFLITESDIWKINSDQVNNYHIFPNRKIIVRAGSLINDTTRLDNSGFFLKKDGFKMIFQKATPIFLTRGTFLHYKGGDFVFQKQRVATLVNYIQQTEDIVQGLPKIEELIEASKPKVPSVLAIRPGVLMEPKLYKEKEKIVLHQERTFSEENTFDYELKWEYDEKKKEPKSKKQKYFAYIYHSIFAKNPILIFQNKIYKGKFLLPLFTPVLVELKKTSYYVFETKKKDRLLIEGKFSFSRWEHIDFEERDFNIYERKRNKLYKFLQVNTHSIYAYKNRRGDLIVKTSNNEYFYLEYLNPVKKYELPLSGKLLYEPGNFVDIGEPITEGLIDIQDLLHILFEYHKVLDGVMKGTKRSLAKFQLLLVNSIQAIYQSQGVNISNKHIEIIVRQMTSRVIVRESGDTPLIAGELIRFSLMNQIYNALKAGGKEGSYKVPSFEPFVSSATSSSLNKDGFLSAAGFQETKKVLTKAAIEGSSDWLRGLKECIIVGRLIPAGSTFLNYKNYLDNIYKFKEKKSSIK